MMFKLGNCFVTRLNDNAVYEIVESKTSDIEEFAGGGVVRDEKVLFKRLKQNFELSYFYSDSPEGIKTQLWIALIAHLLFTVIHKQVKECEQFVTMVSMASNNLGSYICFITMLSMRNKLSATQRDIHKIQMNMFAVEKGGAFKARKNPLNFRALPL